MRGRTLADFRHDIGTRLAGGDLAGAATAASACRAAWPSDPAGWLLGSIAALLADKKEAALALIEERVAADPSDAQCQLQRAECLLAMGRRTESLAAIERVAAGADILPAALDAIGEFLVHAGEHARALQIYTRLVTVLPNDPSMLAKRAVVHRFLGNFEEAASDYDLLLSVSPFDAEALKGLAELRRQSADRNSIAAMQGALAVTAAGSKDAATLHFGLAKSHEDLGEHAASWRHLGIANQLERASIDYDPAQDAEVIERIIDAFPGIEPQWPDSTSERPIFIVGLPRTGTTLVERIIGRHSQVHSAGELTALADAIGAAIHPKESRGPVDWLAYAAALRDLEGPSIAREYLAGARSRRGDRARFTDKQPTNFYYCAVIFRAFPSARIVHLTRHPLAACYAIYKTRFGGTYPFSYDLAELGDFYIGYRRLMDHWRRVLPGRILDVAYEDVVTALEPTTRRVLQYLDLPFEEACLEFHLNPDSTATASAVQVRQPLYESSLHQWQHYEAELAPLRARLEASGISLD